MYNIWNFLIVSFDFIHEMTNTEIEAIVAFIECNTSFVLKRDT